MPKGDYLGELELLVLSAINRLGNDAYGVTIRQEIERQTKRHTSIGAVYSALERLHRKRFVAFRLSDPLPVQGGRARKYAGLTAAGERTLRVSREGFARMFDLPLNARG